MWQVLRGHIMDKPNIVIVGAGLSGVTAAHRLIRKGFLNVHICEASDRIGGRIHTLKYGRPTYCTVMSGTIFIYLVSLNLYILAIVLAFAQICIFICIL